ncbi:hypothetical protein LEP1GSC029_1181 [Leptospira interrogans str. 2002000626]|uniref:Uncharacterized protein n=1 Tax=Leptospira interrogans str. 2002000626 TaxID=996803 RepID=A0A829CPE8_LEPIR|nr:hypothetical protein LEP1GSC029_1181 [Leptospira interrogans str. 2002000626]
MTGVTGCESSTNQFKSAPNSEFIKYRNDGAKDSILPVSLLFNPLGVRFSFWQLVVG